MPDSDDNPLYRGLAVGRAVSITVSGQRWGKTEYMASVRVNLNQWVTEFDTDPEVALRRAVNKAEAKSLI